MPDVEVLVVALGSPYRIGIYQQRRLIEEFVEQEKLSQTLPLQMQTIQSRYHIKALYYAKGPGSFMSIKLSYIFLKSYALLRDIPLYSCDAFNFNNGAPIKAVGKLFFVKNASTISLQPLRDAEQRIVPFSLPTHLNHADFSDENEPYYGIDAV